MFRSLKEDDTGSALSRVSDATQKMTLLTCLPSLDQVTLRANDGILYLAVLEILQDGSRHTISFHRGGRPADSSTAFVDHKDEPWSEYCCHSNSSASVLAHEEPLPNIENSSAVLFASQDCQIAILHTLIWRQAEATHSSIKAVGFKHSCFKSSHAFPHTISAHFLQSQSCLSGHFLQISHVHARSTAAQGSDFLRCCQRVLQERPRATKGLAVESGCHCARFMLWPPVLATTHIQSSLEFHR